MPQLFITMSPNHHLTVRDGNTKWSAFSFLLGVFKLTAEISEAEMSKHGQFKPKLSGYYWACHVHKANSSTGFSTVVTLHSIVDFLTGLEINLFVSCTAKLQYFLSVAEKYSHKHPTKAKTKHPCQLMRHSHLFSPRLTYLPDLRHISFQATAPSQTSPGKLLADGDLKWMENLTFMFLKRTISMGVFLIKPLMEIDLS